MKITQVPPIPAERKFNVELSYNELMHFRMALHSAINGHGRLYMDTQTIKINQLIHGINDAITSSRSG